MISKGGPWGVEANLRTSEIACPCGSGGGGPNVSYKQKSESKFGSRIEHLVTPYAQIALADIYIYIYIYLFIYVYVYIYINQDIETWIH